MKINKKSSLFIYHDLISAIVAALEARDIYTFNHSTRVSNMSEKICRLLKFSEKQTEIIHIASDLHDIGKIGISDEVLLKEGKLKGSEWNEIKKHPVIGYKIVKRVQSFEDIAHIILHHHERWDGKGYPDNLCGLDIPIGARIVAVSDSIDAMLSDRSYRKKMSLLECYDEILKNSGIMYDKDIARCVLENWDEIIASRNL